MNFVVNLSRLRKQRRETCHLSIEQLSIFIAIIFFVIALGGGFACLVPQWRRGGRGGRRRGYVPRRREDEGNNFEARGEGRGDGRGA